MPVNPPLRAAILIIALTTRAQADESSVVDWVKQNAIPLKTAVAGNGFDDMQPIKAIVGNARIVALGEPTHGTREVFQMKHRMLEFLVCEMGFTIFGIEASMPDCAAINEYVLRGTGDPDKVVAGQGFWTWNTEEVRDMVKWMRAYNADPANASKLKLKFYGFDMQHMPSAVNGAIKYLEQVDRESAAKIRPHFDVVFMTRPSLDEAPAEKLTALKSHVADLAKWFDENRDAFIAKSSKEQFDMARQYVAVAQQGLELVDEGRMQASSIGQRAEMVLFNNLVSESKELLAYLEQNHAQLAGESRELLEGLMNLGLFSRKYIEAKPEQKQAWDAQGAKIQKTLADAPDARARIQADNVAKAITVLREYSEKPNRDSVENVRDRCMAENIAWILENEGPDSRIVCWAHNGHVGMTDPKPGQGALTMGSYLERKFKDDHVVIGFAFNRGSFQAVAARPTEKIGLQEWTVGPAKAGSIDQTLAKPGIPMFILDLRNATDGAVKNYFAAEHPMRMAGALFDPATEDTNYYSPVALSKFFDAIIFTDTTTRARPLKINLYSSMDPMSLAMASKPRLGVRLKQSEETGKPGLVLDEVFEGEVASRAGLRAGDRIIKINDADVATMAEFRAAMAKVAEGATAKFTVDRNGEVKVLDVEMRSDKP